MRLISLLNHYQRFPGFVYDQGEARHCAQSQTIEILPCAPAAAQNSVCSGCHKPGPGYDHLGVRRFEVAIAIGLGTLRSCCFIACAGSIAEPAGCHVEAVPCRGSAWRQLDQGLHAVPGALGEEAVLAGDSLVVLQHLGQGLPVGRSMSCSGGSSTGNWD